MKRRTLPDARAQQQWLLQLSMLISAGIPLQQALTVLDGALPPTLQGCWQSVTHALEQGQTLSHGLQQMGTLPPEATAASAMAPVATSSDPGADSGSTDPVLITKIQRGLASLGFLAQKIDGVPGEGTAKAIRNFEVFYDYKVTGLATPQLLNLLTQHGAET